MEYGRTLHHTIWSVLVWRWVHPCHQIGSWVGTHARGDQKRTCFGTLPGELPHTITHHYYVYPVYVHLCPFTWCTGNQYITQDINTSPKGGPKRGPFWVHPKSTTSGGPIGGPDLEVRRWASRWAGLHHAVHLWCCALHYILSVVPCKGGRVYTYVLHTLMHYTLQHTTEHPNTGDDTEVLSRPWDPGDEIQEIRWSGVAHHPE